MTLAEIRAELEKDGKVAIIWSIQDVQALRDSLSDDEAMTVLQKVVTDHDPSYGVTNETVEDVADELFPDDEDEEEGEVEDEEEAKP